MYRRKYRPNPEITLGSRFLDLPIRDYGEAWKECWWREAIQNSVDAGATLIDCKTITNEEKKTVTVSISDNGSGMSREVFITKFLAFGETTKEGEDGTGGFGKAKELLVLPWLFWEMDTQSQNGERTCIQGKGNKYEFVESKREIPGTDLTVVMALDRATTDIICKSFIRKCFIPQTSFIVNGENVAADLLPGKELTANEDLRIFWNEDQKISESVKAVIRINGIYMFKYYLHSSSFEGTVVIELTKPSVEVLESNRNNLSKYEDKSFLSQFFGKLEKDVRSGLRGAGFRVRKIYQGTGKFSTYASDQTADDLTHLVQDLINRKPKTEKIELPPMTIEQIKEAVKLLQDNADTESATPKVIDNSVTPEMAEALLSDVNFIGNTASAAAMQQLLWEPDFFLVNEIRDFKVPAEFTPEGMSPSAKRIARLWAAFCQFVFIQLGTFKRFGIGFIFSHDKNKSGESWIQGEYVREEGQNWILINPYINGNPKGDLYDINDEDHLDKMYALAIHECTHIADGVSYHDEDFSSALTHNIAKTVRGRKNLRAIRDAVRSKFKMYATKSMETRRSFYKILTGSKGKPRLTDTLSEARTYADIFPDRLVKIIGYFMPVENDRSGAVEVGTVEYRFGKQSFRDEVSQDLDVTTSPEETWEYADSLTKNLGYDVPDVWKRNPKKRLKKKRNRKRL